MKKNPPRLFLLILLTLSILACSLPSLLTAPAALPTPSASPAAPNPSQTPAPSPAASPAPTEPLSQPIILDQIHMLTASEGWAWATRNGVMDQLLHTTDSALTWQDVSPHGSYTYNSSYFIDSRTAWLATSNPDYTPGPILRTSDAGLTWQTTPESDVLQNASVTLSSPNDGIALTASIGAGNAYYTAYQTSDAGLTWTVIPYISPEDAEQGLPEGTLHLCNICGDTLYSDPQRVILVHGSMANEDINTSVSLSISTDLGKHWNNPALPINKKYAGTVMPFTPAFFADEGVLPVSIIQYAADGSLKFSVLQLYLTHDGGQSWKASPALLDLDKEYASAVQVISPADTVVRCGRDLCITRDSASSWTRLPNAELNFDTNADAADYISQFTFTDPLTAFLLRGEAGSAALYQTTDDAQTWHQIHPVISAP